MTDERRLPEPREEPRLKALSQAVRARREELGLRQAEVADLAGCSQRFLHTVEHGKASLRLDKVLDVLEVLGLGLEVVPGRGEITSDSERAASPGAAE
jgi:HTH-type transcriptional regulator / antitoxin HipB